VEDRAVRKLEVDGAFGVRRDRGGTVSRYAVRRKRQRYALAPVPLEAPEHADEGDDGSNE